MIYTPGAVYRESPPVFAEQFPCLECGKPMQSLVRYQMPIQWRCIRRGCSMSIFRLVRVPSYTEELNEAISRFQA